MRYAILIKSIIIPKFNWNCSIHWKIEIQLDKNQSKLTDEVTNIKKTLTDFFDIFKE